jgi:hypothetical protein
VFLLTVCLVWRWVVDAWCQGDTLGASSSERQNSQGDKVPMVAVSHIDQGEDLKAGLCLSEGGGG